MKHNHLDKIMSPKLCPGCSAHIVSINTQDTYQYIFFYSPSVILYLETNCSEASCAASSRSDMCLWQHWTAMNHKTWPSETKGAKCSYRGEREHCFSPKISENHIQARDDRFGGGTWASCTCWATNGALSGDCWRRQLCPSGAKWEVTKTLLNLWDTRAGL